MKIKKSHVSAALSLVLVVGWACAGPSDASPSSASSPTLAIAVGEVSSSRTPATPYAEARAKFQTHLVRMGSAPQAYKPISAPAGAQEIAYRSGALTLKAWVSAPPANGLRRPAVLFLHGGFSFGEDDWEMSKPYRDAGFVVLTPMLRGENGLPGNYSMFFGEVDDVLAAADALAALPYVRADRLYIAGHSVGGTLTILAAMSTGRFRAAASLSGSPDQALWGGAQPKLVPFDLNDASEFSIRSPIAYASSFQAPARLYFGSEEYYFAGNTAKLAELALSAGRDVRAVVVPGDHMSHVAESMKQSIVFFREHE